MNSNVPESNLKHKRTSRGSTNDAKSRNWRFLFDNLKRAVGYIYSMCEQDGDIEECKEAIMVLHNRIKEFEGLIQYIEVQANYETSDERPSSVAWEVPVSAIKQPSLPFQPNGDPQLYYYPYIPQAFPQYPVPGTFPMMDPNVMNFMPFNQQFSGFPPEFLGQNGNPPPPPQQNQPNYQQQYNNFPDYNSNNGHSKKGYSKHRRSGSKHDNFKPRSHDGHSSKKHYSQNNLNSLDINSDQTVIVAPLCPPGTDPMNVEVIPEFNNCQLICTPTTDATSVEDIPQSISVEIISECSTSQPIILNDSSTESSNDTAIDNPGLHENTADATCDLKHDQSTDSIAINDEIADAINDKSSVEDAPLSEKREGSKSDWTVVNKDTYVNVTSDGSDHSLPTSPDNMVAKQSTKSDYSSDNDISLNTKLDAPDEVDPETAGSDEEHPVTVAGSDEEHPGTVAGSDEEHPGTADTETNIPEEATSTDPKEVTKVVVCATVSTSNIKIDCQKKEISEGSKKLDVSDNMSEATSDMDSIQQVTECPQDLKEAPAAVSVEKKAETSTSTEVDPRTKRNISKKADCIKSSSKDKVSECHADCKKSVVPQKASESTKSVNRTKVSTSSELTDAEGKEVDVLSESGRSTMSSGSVQSCMSLPPNPLARSTSWADLVRKGKSASPIPTTTRRITSASKYQSTPSRYLSHTQNTTPKVVKKDPQPLSKSKSLPPRASLAKTAAQPVKKMLGKPKEPHVCADGWSVSSGRSRVKTIPNSSKRCDPKLPSLQAKSLEKTRSPVLSPRLGLRSRATDVGSTKARSTDVQGNKAKSAENVEKPKTPRSSRPKLVTSSSSKSTASSKASSTVTSSSKTVTTSSSKTVTSSSSKAVTSSTSKFTSSSTAQPKSAKSSAPPKPLATKSKKQSLTSTKSPSSPRSSVSKPLVKARSLESNTKLSDKLKPSLSQTKKSVSKSSDPIQKVSTAPPEVQAKKVKEVTATKQTEDVDENTTSSSTVSDQKLEGSSSELKMEVEEDVCVIKDECKNVEDELLSENKSIQTEQEMEEQVEIFAVPAGALYPPPKPEDEENCGIYRVMISKRKRQISEQSSVSTDTLDDDDRMCLSPGRSPGRSPTSRGSGGGRSPGKAPQLHQRLSSPSRRRNPTDTVLKNYQERLAKAQVQRDKIQKEKANKLMKIKIKEEQIKDLQEQQEKERVARGIENAEKLVRAEQLRDEKLAEIKRKAQEEEQKVSEIAFINTLEAQNRKMELQSKEVMAEAKRAEIQVRQQEERKRRSEELQAKEDAVLERKQAIEADRLARIAHIEDKIKESQAKVDSKKQEMETAAKEAAKEKALEREMTLELVRHDRSTNSDRASPHGERTPNNERRSKQSRQQVSKLNKMQEKAAMLCRNPEYLPSHTLYEPAKWCSKCNMKIVSEAVLMSHMVKRHQKSSQVEAELESQYIIDYTDGLCPVGADIVNRQKQLRKRAKKVKSRITNKITELPPIKLLEAPKDCPNKNRLYKCIKAINNPKTLEKGLTDLSRTVLVETDINHLIDKGVIEQLCGLLTEKQTLSHISKLLLLCCRKSTTGSQICVRSLPQVVECLHSSIASRSLHCDLLQLTTTLLRSLPPCDGLTSDVVSYIVCKEVLDNIHTTCTRITHLKDDSECEDLLNCLELLSVCCVAMTTANVPISTSPSKSDPSQLIEALVFTKACNIITLLYGVLLYDGPPRSPPPLDPTTLRVVRQCLATLLDISRFSLHTLQWVMDSEGMSLEMRHVCSYVLCSASLHGYTAILDSCVQLIGFVVFQHPSNQVLLQNGPSRSILQLLSSLPFSYFSDVQSMHLLFPTLISACYNCPSNLAILQEKVNKVMLISYLKEQLKDKTRPHINFYPLSVFQEALKFLQSPDPAAIT